MDKFLIDFFSLLFIFLGIFIFLCFCISSGFFGLIKKRTIKPMEPHKKAYTEEEIFFYAHKRIADIFNISIDKIDLDNAIGEGYPKVTKAGLFHTSELDLIENDMEDTAWNTTEQVIEKIFPGENRKALLTYREFCQYMVCCYRYCTEDSYKMILETLQCEAPSDKLNP